MNESYYEVVEELIALYEMGFDDFDPIVQAYLDYLDHYYL